MKVDIALVFSAFFCFELVLFFANLQWENCKVLVKRVAKAKIVKCEICSHVYFISSITTYSKCPMCLSIAKTT